MGIKTGCDLKRLERFELQQKFGKNGNYYYNIAHGIDERPVNPSRIRKSVGKERTFKEDIIDKEYIKEILLQISQMIGQYLQKYNIKGKTITVKVKYHDFSVTTRSFTNDIMTDNQEIIYNKVLSLLEKTEAGKKSIRLVGISVSNLDTQLEENLQSKQLHFLFQK